MVRPRHAVRAWRVENAEAAPARLTGWGLAAELPGFHKLTELKRRLGESRPVGQMVYSDGLAAVSVFIEPQAGVPAAPTLSYQGAVNIYTRSSGAYVVTVLGEAPAATLMHIANSLEQKPTTAALQ
jgi:sigma-E factor negative regulatory protein RseB